MPEIPQEQLDQLTAKAKEADEYKTSNEKLTKDLETTRLEVLSPEYTKFLESLEKGDKDKTMDKNKDKTEEEDDLKGLTPKQLLARAKKEALDELKLEKSKEQEETNKEQKARNAREIEKFKKDHDDFDTYRPIMYGLSKMPENADMTISELYTASKKHVQTIKTGSTDEQKDKSRRSTNDKPGNDNNSFERTKKMSSSELNREALEEVKKDLGPIPAA